MNKITNMVISIIIIMATVLPMATVLAADSYWGSSTGNFSDGSSWESGGVPGVGDNAYFENNASYTVDFTGDATCANAYFDALGGIVTLDADTHEWTLSNNFIVGNDASASATVVIDSGTITADSVSTPNVTTGGVGDDWITLNAGVLNTSGADIRMATTGYSSNEADFRIGNSDGLAETMTWNITSGLNFVYTTGPDSETGNHTHIGGVGDSDARGIVNVSGAGTVFSNSYGIFLGSAQGWGGDIGTVSNELNVSSGAKVYSSRTYIGFRGSYSKLTVDGTGSLYQSAYMACSKAGQHVRVEITDGGSIECSGILSLGNEGGDSYAECLIDGIGSTMHVGALQVGYGGSYNHMVITNGGSLITEGNINLGKNTGMIDNTILVTGTDSTFNCGGTVYMEASNGVICVENAGYVYLNSGEVAGYCGSNIVRGADSILSYNRIYVRPSCTLLVETGGVAVSRNSSMIVGSASGGTGHIRIIGEDASVLCTNSYYVRIGGTSGGNGDLLIEDGGRFVHNLGDGGWPTSIGYAAGSTGLVTVVGEGSELYSDSTARLAIGENGTGILRIKDGGRARSRNGAVGYLTGSTGVVSIVGGGSSWTNVNDVAVGRSDGASRATLEFELNETGCGKVYVPGTMTINPDDSYLNVDLSNYQTDEAVDFVLVECGTLSGTFDEDKISVTGLNGGTIVQDTVNDQIILHVNGQRGTVIVVK